MIVPKVRGRLGELAVLIGREITSPILFYGVIAILYVRFT